MKYTVNNRELGTLVRRDGSPGFPERFWAEGAESAVFTLAAGKNQFAWGGFPGERYQVWAPLNATAWGEDERARFARWNCAVFTPVDMSRPRIPVVFCYTGISGDYSDTALFLQSVVEKAGCIFVAMETHLTGTRHLAPEDTPFSDRFYESLLRLEQKGCGLRDAFFCEVVEELAFNACLVLGLIQQRYSLRELPPIVTMGFSLGGYYAAQIACRLPQCIAAVCGGAAPSITLYGGMYYTLARCMPDCVYRFLRLPKAVAALGPAVKRVRRDPVDIATAGDAVSKVFFVIGERDALVSVDSVRRVCKDSSALSVHAVPGAEHNPSKVESGCTLLNALGKKMEECLLDALSSGVTL